MKDQSEMTFAVALHKCNTYEQAALDEAVAKVLEAAKIKPASGSKLLVKPNLLRAHKLTCTSPEVVLAACRYFKNFDITVVVGDSPGFGSALSVAGYLGLTGLLAPLGIKIVDFAKGSRIHLPHAQTSLKISSAAQEADLILSLPRLKAHQQMGVTAAVKNCFGCISGLCKARVHTTHGQSHEKFAALILEMYEKLPPVAGLVDAVESMHITGPSGGKSYPSFFIGASANAMALDCALYCMMGLEPCDAPLWQGALAAGRKEANPKNLFWPLQNALDFDLTNFIVPSLGSPSFNPWFLLKSSCRRIWARAKWARGKGRTINKG